MSFVFPLFLIAGISIAIPILIHLFNLRRYKTVIFPHTRFLKDIKLQSQKQSQLRYKWLLAARILFLLFLVFAFAQPFFKTGTHTGSRSAVDIIYIDNSYALSQKEGSQLLLDKAKQLAIAHIKASDDNQKFAIINNDRLLHFQAVSKERAIQDLQNIDFSSIDKNDKNIFSSARSFLENNQLESAQLYYLSGFARASFGESPDTSLLQGLNVHFLPIRSTDNANIYIDTAYFVNPVLKSREENSLVVRTKYVGKAAGELQPTLQLYINDKLSSTGSINFSEGSTRLDTLLFSVASPHWQQIRLQLEQSIVPFDDTFYISARSNSAMQVSQLYAQQPNSFINAAFQADDNFRLYSAALHQNREDNINASNLIVLSNMKELSEDMGNQVKNWLQQGKSVAFFPDRNTQVSAFNPGLTRIASIQFTGLDTVSQSVSHFEKESDLARNLFERMPDNVQLPAVSWHYIIENDLSENRQSVLSFSNGAPYLAQYKIANGNFYVCAASADLSSGNFVSSYFFAPLLYQMAAQASAQDIYALQLGSQKSIYIPLIATNDRSILQLKGNGISTIPQQYPSGSGTIIVLNTGINRAGYYSLAAENARDSIVLAFNTNRQVSRFDFWELSTLESHWKGAAISWDSVKSLEEKQTNKGASFPLWKVCVILALIMLLLESYFLQSRIKPAT